ncbi:MAG: ParB/RepB/Spo0J family partition protein [Arenicella sp.]
MELVIRQLADIKRNSGYLRHGTDVENLKKSIESIGLINPLTVNKNNELLAGSRRFQAITELGWKEVEVHVVDRDLLQQELISIDENLVREPLNRLEVETCLNRGREIYEELNPKAVKIKLSNEPSESEAGSTKQEDDNDSFAAITAEKTGLSMRVIQSAIKRDALASDSVKQARSQGELNATQTNQIIQLDKDMQEKVLPLIADKTVKQAQEIIKAVKKDGMEAAIKVNDNIVPMPSEYALMKSPIKRMNKNLSRILIEGMKYEGPEQEVFNKDLEELQENLAAYFKMIEVG